MLSFNLPPEAGNHTAAFAAAAAGEEGDRLVHLADARRAGMVGRMNKRALGATFAGRLGGMTQITSWFVEPGATAPTSVVGGHRFLP